MFQKYHISTRFCVLFTVRVSHKSPKCVQNRKADVFWKHFGDLVKLPDLQKVYFCGVFFEGCQ